MAFHAWHAYFEIDFYVFTQVQCRYHGSAPSPRTKCPTTSSKCKFRVTVCMKKCMYFLHCKAGSLIKVGVVVTGKYNKCMSVERIFYLSYRTAPELLHVIVVCQHRPHNINPVHFSQNGFICEILCLSTCRPRSINVAESTWECVTALAKRNICVKILLHANIRARKAAVVIQDSNHSVIFDQIKAEILFRRVNHLYQATFTCPILFRYRFNMNGSITQGWITCRW